MAYKKHIVAFIDILGFKNLVETSENSLEKCEEIRYILKRFLYITKRKTWKRAKKLMEIEEDAQKRELSDFYVDNMVKTSSFSDSIIIAIEAEDKINERTSALIALLSEISMELLASGVLTRGAISYGNLYADKKSNIFYGRALNEAYLLESTISIFPRIILSDSLVNSLKYPLCTKRDRHPYHQYVRRFNDGLVGISPVIFLQVMDNAPSVISDSQFYTYLSNIKEAIISGLDKSFEDKTTHEKYLWLMNCYNKLIILNENHERYYRKIASYTDPNGGGNIHYKYINDLYDSYREQLR